MVQMSQPRLRAGSGAPSAAAGLATPTTASPTRNLLRSVQRRSTLGSSNEGNVAETQDKRKARSSLVAPTSSQRVSTNTPSSIPGPPPAPSATAIRRQSGLFDAPSSGSSRVEVSRKGAPATSQRKMPATPQHATPSQHPVTRRTATAAGAAHKGQQAHKAGRPIASAASSPFIDKPAKPDVRYTAQLEEKDKRIAELLTERDALVQQATDTRSALEEATELASQARTEASRFRDAAEAAGAVTEKRWQLREVQEREATETLDTANAAAASTASTHLAADLSASIGGSIHALRSAAESGHGLTRDAARALEREFAGQERILQAFQRDNEAKTAELALLRRQKAKLEAFCAKYFGEDDWQAAVYGVNKTKGLKAGASDDARQHKDSDGVTSSALRTIAVSADSAASRSDVREGSDTGAHATCASPLAVERLLQPRCLNRAEQAPWPACSSPFKRNAASSAFPSPAKTSGAQPGPAAAAAENSFVSAQDVLDESAWAAAGGASRENGPPAVTVDYAAIMAVVEAQEHLLHTVRQWHTGVVGAVEAASTES